MGWLVACGPIEIGYGALPLFLVNLGEEQECGQTGSVGRLGSV